MCLHLNGLSVIHYFSVGFRQKEVNRSSVVSSFSETSLSLSLTESMSIKEEESENGKTYISEHARYMLASYTVIKITQVVQDPNTVLKLCHALLSKLFLHLKEAILVWTSGRI